MPNQGFVAQGLLLLLGAGCVPPAGSPPPGPCADTTQVLALPTPLWEQPGQLMPPSKDRAAALLRGQRPGWLEQVSALDGWPARPTFVLPLSAAATGVAPDRFLLFDARGAPLPMQFDASLSADGLTVVVTPRNPVPGGVNEAVLAVEAGAVEGAQVLPACGEDGVAHPAYAAAAKALPSPYELALPFRVSRVHEALGLLWTQLVASPVLTVKSAQARALADYGAQAPPAGAAALLRPQAVQGLLTLPAYRGANGWFQLDASGSPVAAGTTEPGFIVALPAQGSPPYPFVLFQHGGGQNKADFFALAEPLLEAGFAFVAIDLPFHGDRAKSGAGAVTDMLDFNNPLATRDNFRQAVADHLAVLTGVPALNVAVEQTVGVANALSSDRAYYMGLSLGAISGSVTFSVAPRVNAAALFVGGGGFPELVSSGLFSLLMLDVLGLPAERSAVVLGFLEALLAGADPLSYAQRAEDQTAPPRSALFLQAVDDPVVGPAASDGWARAFGASLAQPFNHAVPGMPAVALPAAGNFTWATGGASATRVLVQNPMNEVAKNDRHPALITLPYAQQLVAHCLAGVLAHGACEVVDTGYAAH